MSAMSIFGVLWVSLFGALQASFLAEDCDETVLLQRKFTTRSQQLAAPLLQEPLELTQDNMAEHLEAIEKLLQGPEAGETDVNSIKQMLEDQMEAYLMELHTAAETEWQTAQGRYTACGTHRERRFDNVTGDVVLGERVMHQARLKHQACRRSEKAWNTFHAMSYSPPADLAVHNVDEAATTFCEALSNAQSLAQTYNGLVPVGKHDCLTDQTSFEWSACTWEAKANEACNAYNTCTAAMGLQDLRNRLLVDGAERRALWHTIGILKCRIDALASSGVAPSDGADGTNGTDGSSEYVDPCADLIMITAHLVLNLPDPQPNDCTDDQLPPLMSPSTQDSAQCAVWMGTEYSWDPSEAVVPAACATTCLGIHPPQPPSDCEDTSSQCEFYQLHPSACGSFPADGQAFQACNDCCYCRFSPGCGTCPPGYRIHQGGTACQECPEGQITNADSTECVDPEPCVASVDCSSHGTTDDFDKSDGCVCSCGNGYLGLDCSTPPPCDAAADCSGHGATVDLDSTDGCECACDDGFEGAACLIAVTQSVGGGPIYKMDVSENEGAGYWCIEELSFYDADGNRVATQSGMASAETEASAGNAAGMAFNEITDDLSTGIVEGGTYCSQNGVSTGWLQYQFESGTAPIGSYRVGGPGNTCSPVSWQMQQSLDGGQTWTVIDEQSGHSNLQPGSCSVCPTTRHGWSESFMQ